MIRGLVYTALWAALTALTWQESRLLHKARHNHEDIVALREREIASYGRATALTGGAILGVNVMMGCPLPLAATPLILTITLIALSIPGVRFIRQYYLVGFR